MKYILPAAILIALALGVMLKIQHDKLVSTKKDLSAANSAIEGHEKAAEKKDKELKDLQDARLTYITDLQESQNEINTLRNDLATGKRVLTVSANCPKVGTDTTSTGSASSPARLDAVAERAYTQHIDRIKYVMKTCENWRQELLIRHASQKGGG